MDSVDYLTWKAESYAYFEYNILDMKIVLAKPGDWSVIVSPDNFDTRLGEWASAYFQPCDLSLYSTINISTDINPFLYIAASLDD